MPVLTRPPAVNPGSHSWSRSLAIAEIKRLASQHDVPLPSDVHLISDGLLLVLLKGLVAREGNASDQPTT